MSHVPPVSILLRFIQHFPLDFTHRCLSSPGSHGDPPSSATQRSETQTLDATLAPLLKEWASAKLTHSPWKDALVSAVSVSVSFCSCARRVVEHTVGLQFKLPRVAVYRALCERLRSIDRITDVVECFHQGISELGGKTMRNEHLEWALGEWSCALRCSCLSNIPVRLQARFGQEAGASRGYSYGCPAI